MPHDPSPRTSPQQPNPPQPSKVTDPPTLTAALRYIEEGWRIFPVDQAKRPVNAHGALGPFVESESEARRYWGNGSKFGIAAATGRGLFVLDVDLPFGPESAICLEDTLGPLPPTRMSKTASRGAQLLFRVPTDFPHKNSIGKLAPGLDTRCNASYVVLPPSYGNYVKDLGEGPVEVRGHWQWRTTDDFAELPKAWQEAVLALDKPSARQEGQGGRPPHRIDTLLEDATKPGKWHESVLALTSHMVARGRSDCEILAFAHDLTRPPKYSIDDTREELRVMIEGARDKGWTPPEPPPESLGLSRHIRIISPSEIQAKVTGNWLVRGVVPMVGLGAIYGPPGGGKTFVALDIALAIARGIPWRGCRTKHAAVLYLCPDGGEMVQNRVVTYCQHHGIEASAHSLFLAPSHIDLLSTKPTDDVRKTIVLIEEAFGVRLGAVVVDTASRAMPGGDENAAKDVTRLIDNLAQISDGKRIILAVHHTPKSDATMLRGHGALHGACDFELNIADRTITIAKQRDGETGRKYGFELEVIEIGNDEDGNPVTSCVVVETGSVQPSQPLQDEWLDWTLCNAKRFLSIETPGSIEELRLAFLERFGKDCTPATARVRWNRTKNASVTALKYSSEKFWWVGED